jgi:hypothetical protein
MTAPQFETPTHSPDIMSRLFREGFAVVRQKNVLRPLLALDAIFITGAFCNLVFGHIVQTESFYAACALVLFTVIAYSFFAVTNPRWLQSEDYQLRSHTMGLYVESKAGIVTDKRDLSAATPPALNSGEETA